MEYFLYKCLLADIKKVLPEVKIWLGGPEVSYCGEEILREQPVGGSGDEGRRRGNLCTALKVLVEKEESGVSFSGYLEEIKQKGIPGLVFWTVRAIKTAQPGALLRAVIDRQDGPFMTPVSVRPWI